MHELNSAPVFIVGIQRSGTTLLAAMLGAHPRLSCGPETHFFRRLSQINPDQLCVPDTWPQRGVDFVSSIKHTDYIGGQDKYLLEKYHLAKQEIGEYLANKEPSIPNVLASVTESYMLAVGKSRWVEKTPDHYKYVNAIRDYFPSSPIIRILRDPRDVSLSLTKLPWGAQSFHEGLFFWLSQYQASEEFFSSDRNCYTLRYEDLILSPTDELQKLCAFIGEEYSENMQDTSNSGTQINSRNVPWKKKVGQPIDTSRVYAWKGELSREQNKMAEALLGNLLDKYGYPRLEAFDRLGIFYPESGFVINSPTALETLSAKGIRFWNLGTDEKYKVKVYLGDPENNHWFIGGKLTRIYLTLVVALEIVQSSIFGKEIYWVPDDSSDLWSGFGGFLLKRLLTPYKLLS